MIRILSNFDWSKFAPLIVTPVEDGRYAIIDGQHRATAAYMHPQISVVPCMIVDVSPEDAAACFAAINGQVTSISKMQIHHALVRAGDPDAIALDDCLRAADVRVLKYKTPNMTYAPGDTLAIGALEKCLASYGRETLITALQAITMSGHGNAGCVVAPLIYALCEVFNEDKALRDSGDRLLKIFDEFSLADFIAEAGAISKKMRRPVKVVMKEQLLARFAPRVSGNTPRALESVS